MKVNIGPYRRDLVPISSWQRRYEQWRSEDHYLDEADYTWYDKIIMRSFDFLYSVFLPLNCWSNNRPRKVKVHIDDYDVWGADHTLAMIIHPVLVKLKQCKQGSPNVDDEDVPEHLKSTSAGPKENEWDTDEFHHTRWDYVLDEMIWAFEQHTDENCNDNQFHHNPEQLDILFEPITEGDLAGKAYSTIKMNHQKDPNKPKYWIDEEGKKAHYERIDNGRRLFAKYFSSLWD